MMYSGLLILALLSGINMASQSPGYQYDSAKVDNFYKSQKDYGLKDHRGDNDKLDEYLSYFDDNMEICGSSDYYKWDDDKNCHNKEEYKCWLENKYNGYYQTIDTNFDIIIINAVIIIIDIDFIFIDDFGCTFNEWELVEISYDEYGKITKYEIKDSKYDDSNGCNQDKYIGDGYRDDKDYQYDTAKVDNFYKSQKEYGLKAYHGDYNKLDEYLSYFDDNMEICGSSDYYKWDDDKYCHNKDEYKYWLENRYNGYYQTINTDFQVIVINVVIIIIDIDFTFIDEFGCTSKEWELIEITYDSYGKITKYEIKDSQYDDSYHCDEHKYDEDDYHRESSWKR